MGIIIDFQPNASLFSDYSEVALKRSVDGCYKGMPYAACNILTYALYDNYLILRLFLQHQSNINIIE